MDKGKGQKKIYNVKEREKPRHQALCVNACPQRVLLGLGMIIKLGNKHYKMLPLGVKNV